MSKSRNPSAMDSNARTRDQALRLAVAATSLGMAMGIAPATVLGADEVAQPTAAPSSQTQDAAGKPDVRFEKIPVTQQESARQTPDGKFLKIDTSKSSDEKTPIREQGATRGTQEPPAGYMKFQ